MFAPFPCRCALFTSVHLSMAHAKDFMQLANVGSTDYVHEGMYEYFASLGRADIVKQLERLYILHYLAENTDLHEYNFGFLYDPVTFKILRVAPAYDFNSAFGGWCDVRVYYAWILAKLPTFMGHSPDIKQRLETSAFVDWVKRLPLTRQTQYDSVIERATYLCSLT